MYDAETQRKIDEIKKRRAEGEKNTEQSNAFELTKEELRLKEQVQEYSRLALSPTERRAYEKVLMTFNLNGLARNQLNNK